MNLRLSKTKLIEPMEELVGR